MKLTKQSLQSIRSFAKNKIGGFGMWIELAEKRFYRGEERIENHNMLTPHDKGTRDLNDFSDWKSVRYIEFDLVGGYCLLDFYVHDKDELRDNIQVLVDKNGNVVKMWITWANEEELAQLTGMQLI